MKIEAYSQTQNGSKPEIVGNNVRHEGRYQNKIQKTTPGFTSLKQKSKSQSNRLPPAVDD